MRSWTMRLLTGGMVAGALGLNLAGTRLQADAEGQRLLDQPRGWSRDAFDRDRGPQETETVDRTVALPASGTVRIKNFSGSIQITPASGSNVALKATRRASRDTLDHVTLEVTSSGSDVVIEANRRDASWDRPRNENDVVDTRMELQVPASADLDIDAFSSDVTVEGMNGDQRIKTFSGTIAVRGLKGEIDAETFSADIRVTLDAAAKGSVSFDSFSGSLDSDVAISSMLTERSSRRGRRSRNIEGTLPGGAGPRMQFHTFSGDVELRKS